MTIKISVKQRKTLSGEEVRQSQEDRGRRKMAGARHTSGT